MAQLVGGRRDGEVLAVADPPPASIQLSEPTAAYYVDLELPLPPLVPLPPLRTYRLVRWGKALAVVKLGAMLDRRHPDSWLGEPVTDFDLDVAGGWRYVLEGVDCAA